MANSQNLEEMKLPELKELAKQMGLRGTSTMRKPELIATLQAARNGGEAPEGVTVRAPKNTEPRRTRTAEQTPAAEPAAPQAAAAPEQPAAPAAEPAEQAERRPRRAAHERQSADEFASTLLDELDLGAKPESREHRHQDEVDDSGQPMRRRRRGERDQKHAPADRQRVSEPDHELDDILAALPDQKHEDEGADHEFSRRNRNRGDRNNNAAGNDRRQRRMRGRDRENTEDREEQQRPQEDLVPVAGIVDVLDSYAFVRTSGYLPGPNDVYVSMGQVKKYGLRKGDAVHGTIRPPREGERRNQRQKFVPLQAIDSINGMSVEEAANRPQFAKLTPLYPQERLKQETTPNKLTGRLIDIVAPIGKGQRGLIVSPPKAGKTITLQNIANAITTNNPEVHLMVVLVDERPEEVTDMERTVQGEV
ncbi:Rho termination factor N-terminal domain-containing protein, partial [Bifidobacterium pullorum]|uniref:Rho termination factor N-terminal domain-containing protein n=1 Tax=Bifidobacterium pullorum TaxID=78448 RepID=UPI003AF8CA44